MLKHVFKIKRPTQTNYLIYCYAFCLSCLVNAEPVLSSDHNINNKHKIDTQLSFIGQHQTSGNTWLAGDIGRYDLSSNNLLSELQLSYQYTFDKAWSFNSHIQAQQASESLSSNSLGLVEFHIRYTSDIDWR
tara:strand:- start:1362 stop:1757 length:396 start_codon:yes stop_codon:yes gene_type:complete